MDLRGRDKQVHMGRMVNILAVIGALLIVSALVKPQSAAAQFRVQRPSFGMPQRPQPQPVDICAEYGAFGYANRLLDQHISCWQRKFRTGKLTNEPFHPQLEFFAPPLSEGGDSYGLSPKDWLELSDADLLGRFLVPERMNIVLEDARAGHMQAVVLFYMAGQLANEPFLYGPKASPLIASFGAAYPACRDVDVLNPASGVCAVGFAALRKRFQAAGIGKQIVHAGQPVPWYLYALALARSEPAKTFPRAQWLGGVAQPDSEPFNLQDANNLVLAWRNGVRPSFDRVQRMANGCSGSSYVRQAMANNGVSLQAVTDRAVQFGNAEAARSFSELSRSGTCGAPADRKMAFRYMLKAAEMGDAKAIHAVSVLYAHGDGVAQNPREAINWARKTGNPDTAFIARLEKDAKDFDVRLAREGRISDVAGKAPNIATVRAVLLREMRWAYENHDMGLQSGLAAMFGNQTEWDEETGTVRMGMTDRMGRDHANMSVRSVQSFSVGMPSCTANATGFSCRYAVSVYMDSSMGAMKLADNITSPFTTVTDQFTFENGRWRSPTARARMLSGLRAPPSGSAAGNAGRSGLCRSLNAGMVAAGGKSTSTALNPSTWGC